MGLEVSNMAISRPKVVFLSLILIVFIATPSLLSVKSDRYITGALPLKSEYKQNENLEVIGVIMNNDTAIMQVQTFNVLVTSSTARPNRNATVYVNITIDVYRDLEGNESYTAYVKVPLQNLLPDTYNVTAFFKIKYYGEETEDVYVIENAQIKIRPYIEIPPAAMVVLVIMIGIIIIYIGYGIAGRFSKKKS